MVPNGTSPWRPGPGAMDRSELMTVQWSPRSADRKILSAPQ